MMVHVIMRWTEESEGRPEPVAVVPEGKAPGYDYSRAEKWLHVHGFTPGLEEKIWYTTARTTYGTYRIYAAVSAPIPVES